MERDFGKNFLTHDTDCKKSETYRRPVKMAGTPFFLGYHPHSALPGWDSLYSIRKLQK